MPLTRVATRSELALLQPRCVTVDGIRYVLIDTGRRISCFVSVCPHESKWFVPRMVRGDQLLCPLHDVTFDPETGAVHDPNGKRVPRGLLPVTTRTMDGQVYIDAGTAYVRQFVEASERARQRRKKSPWGLRKLAKLMRW